MRVSDHLAGELSRLQNGVRSKGASAWSPAMEEPLRTDATQLLRRVHEGDENALAEVLVLLHGELRQCACKHLRRQRRDHTLQPTDLVGEIVARLLGAQHGPWNDRAHFLAAASVAMQNILVDYARHKRRRVDSRPVTEDEEVADALLAEFEQHAIDLEALKVALDELEQRDPEMARFVRIRFFSYQTMEQCADALHTPKSTLEKRWAYWRLWLHRKLS
jgi:RNA polymerase sigma factor (TIGR02999 family)